jgi:adenylate cyclase, class 2
MASPKEVEIKFRIIDIKSLPAKLKRAGFKQITPATHEVNTLYDLPGQQLRGRGELLRVRKYGKQWVLTHKARSVPGRHKTRVERETKLSNGKEMEAILTALGFAPTFRYEKLRSEWSDGKGHVVIDQTPIGDFGEIEGPARWIDRTAKALEITTSDYITASYAELFFGWKRKTRSPAMEMTFRAVGVRKPAAKKS